ncbi:GntR family transcriptional regulator [Streptomyces malaysiensis]|uniref:GntR family transcriptional regulator n=1 Tax=Streptomyces malaysiensis subsp. samsunensis TaxID=459658 RepID=A0A9X2LU37_STRMQ|nr:GntR family transcriptional regulator [Streptomyces samsunensis]MCQ8828109.1 GntR family transcriptional regulator [Streptomyces samsunensis]
MSIQLVTQSVGDALVTSLRERILADEITAGTAVTEASVATEYKVARQTAKAAIERLVGEGLLERTAHRSARVPMLDEARVRDLYFARGVIEVRAYELLAGRRLLTPEALTAHEAFRECSTNSDVAALVQADVAFHRALIDSLESDRLSRAHSVIINEIRLCLAQVQNAHLLAPAEIAEEHQTIIAAIRDGDVPGAGQVGLEHLEHAERNLLAHLRG